MADYLDVGKIVSEGYKAGTGISEDIASKDVLKQMYAGQTPEDIKDPIKQVATLNQAAGMLNSKGLSSAAYKLQKQAGDLSTDVNKQQLDTLKVKVGELEYAGQLLQSASSPEDLQNVINQTVKDPAARMSVESIMRNPNLDFKTKKAELIKMTETADQHLKAQQIAATAANTLSQIQNRAEDNVRAAKEIALKQANIYTTAQKPIPIEIARAAGLLPSGEAAPSAPVSVRQNNPLNLTDPKTGEIRTFATPEEGAEAGKKDLQGKIAGTSDAYKAKFGNKPVTPERLAETWSPAGAKGNTKESTANYAKAIADAANIKIDEPIENTTQTRDKVYNAMVAFEAGPAYAAKPTEGLSLDKPGRAGISKPSTDTPTSFVGSTGTTYAPKDERETQLFANVAGPYKEPGVNNIKTNTNVTVAANEMKIGLDNMAILTNKGEKVPSRGAFSNLKTDTFFGAAASAATGPMSNVATQQFEALALPLIRQQATLILGTSASETDRKNLEKSLMTQAFAQSPVLAYQKLAEFAQSARAGIEGQASNPTLNKSQRESLVKAYQAINKAYPYTPQDVFTWQNQVKEGSKQTFGNYVAEKYPESGGNTTTPESKPTAPMSSFLIKKD